MRRRHSEIVDPWQFVFDVFHMPLDWPWKRASLARRSDRDYRQRSLSSNPSIAELYHENSKLYEERLHELAAISVVDATELSSEFVRRRAMALPGDHPRSLELDHAHRSILASFVSSESHLSYEIELRLLSGAELAIHEPITDTLRVIKQLSSEERGTTCNKLYHVLDRMLCA